MNATRSHSHQETVDVSNVTMLLVALLSLALATPAHSPYTNRGIGAFVKAADLYKSHSPRVELELEPPMYDHA